MTNKVGILTFHRGNNYGASLQCYALMKEIQKLGKNVEVIDFYKEKKYGGKISFNKIARKLYGIPYAKQLKNKKIKFKKFNEEFLIISEEKNILEEEIYSQKINFSGLYDTIVFGSDQIWNLDEKIYDKSNIYYGDFKFNGKKVSYAASFGDDLKIEKENVDFIKEKLNGFDKISVREKCAKEFLDEIDIESKLVVDPTLLLTTKEWDEIISEDRIIKEKYILYYSVNCRKYSWKIAKKLSKLTGLKVINLTEHPKILGSGFKNYYKAGPIEFLNIIKNAEYVVTNSFHGTVFSALFNKKMIVAFDEVDGNIVYEERKYNLLKQLNLTNCIKTCSNKIDISEIKELERNNEILKLRNIAIDYIKEILE